MICNIGRVGDTILSNAILDSAFRTCATVDYIGGKQNMELLYADTRLEQVTVVRNSFAGFVSVLKTILRARYDGFIGIKDCYSSTNLIMAAIIRSRVKTGWNGERFRPFHRDVRSISVPAIHKVEMMRRIGQLAGLEAGEYKPSLIVAPKAIEEFRRKNEWDKPFILLNLSATDASARMWPVENWTRYVQGCGLAEERILVNGLPRDRHLVDYVCEKLPGAVAFQAKGFMDVAAAIAHARLVMSVDTGVVHACSALDTPVVAFYCGGEFAIKYGPLSTWGLAIQAPVGYRVPDIPVEQAIAETQRHGLPPGIVGRQRPSTVSSRT